MLDHFLTAAHGAHQRAEAQQKLAAELTKLPMTTLVALASGREKLAYPECGNDAAWLDRFKGTPLFEQAFAIEQADLQLRMHEQQAQAAERASRDQGWSERSAVRDVLGVRRKALELELAALEEGLPSPQGEEVAPVEPSLPPEKAAEAVGEGRASSTLRGLGGALAGGLAGHVAGAVAEGVTGAPVRGLGSFAGGALGGVLGARSADRANREHGRQQVLKTLRTATPSRTPEVAEKEAAARFAFSLALQKLAAAPVQAAPAPARPTATRDQMDEWIGHHFSGGYDPQATYAEGLRGAQNEAAELRALGADADANPTKYRVRRGIAGGAVGGMLGGTLGALAQRPGLGAALGAVGGATLAAAPKPNGNGMREWAGDIEHAIASLPAHQQRPALKQANMGAALGSVMSAGKAALPRAASVGKSALSLAGKHPGMAGLGAGFVAGKVTG